jgi:hypothetical protein
MHRRFRSRRVLAALAGGRKRGPHRRSDNRLSRNNLSSCRVRPLPLVTALQRFPSRDRRKRLDRLFRDRPYVYVSRVSTSRWMGGICPAGRERQSPQMRVSTPLKDTPESAPCSPGIRWACFHPYRWAERPIAACGRSPAHLEREAKPPVPPRDISSFEARWDRLSACLWNFYISEEESLESDTACRTGLLACSRI